MIGEGIIREERPSLLVSAVEYQYPVETWLIQYMLLEIYEYLK